MLNNSIGSRVCFMVVPLLVACGEGVPTAPQGAVLLRDLRFAEAQVAVGQPLVLVARLESGQRAAPEQVLLQTSRGDQRLVRADPLLACVSPEPTVTAWDGCSDSTLAMIIAAVDGGAMIAFKEAREEHGADETGRNITSDSTVAKMREWLVGLGVRITSDFSPLVPAVAVRMDSDAELVGVIRSHENIDDISANLTLELHAGAESPPFPPVEDGLLGVIPTRGQGAWLRAGDTVTATYRQPDGSLLTATALVREANR